MSQSSSRNPTPKSPTESLTEPFPWLLLLPTTRLPSDSGSLINSIATPPRPGKSSLGGRAANALQAQAAATLPLREAVSTLRKYRRFYGVCSVTANSKDELMPHISKHFETYGVNEDQALAKFLEVLRSRHASAKAEAGGGVKKKRGGKPVRVPHPKK